ncbi:MAG: hypothetical protein ACLVKO_02510 [Dysgonomonas sp.]
MIDKELIDIIPTLPIILNPEDINESTRLESDLHLYGFQAQGFIYHYSEIYNIDISNFCYKKYFSKGTTLYKAYRSVFKRRKNVLTMGDLQAAVKYRKLNDSVLKDISEKQTVEIPHNKIYLRTSVRYKPEDILISILITLAIAILLSIAAIAI